MVFVPPGRRALSPRVLIYGQVAALALAAIIFYGPVTTLWDMGRASRQFPVLSDFETRLEAGRWSGGTIHEGIARHGEKSLRVTLRKQKYPGTTLKRSFGDWRGYSGFAFSLYNPDPEAPAHNRVHSRRGALPAGRRVQRPVQPRLHHGTGLERRFCPPCRNRERPFIQKTGFGPIERGGDLYGRSPLPSRDVSRPRPPDPLKGFGVKSLNRQVGKSREQGSKKAQG